ncbi:MAG TPA: hypothetical protein VFG00_10880 [Acidothermaceae bacterium]|nr:hypothetical protein [Acidothermaceae bacterium]
MTDDGIRPAKCPECGAEAWATNEPIIHVDTCSRVQKHDWPRTMQWLDGNQRKIATIQRGFTPAPRDLPFTVDEVALVMIRIGFDALSQAANWFQLKTGPRYDVYIDTDSGYHEFFQADDWVELEDSLRGSLFDAGVPETDVDQSVGNLLGQIEPQTGGTASESGITVRVEGPYPGDPQPASLTGQTAEYP